MSYNGEAAVTPEATQSIVVNSAALAIAKGLKFLTPLAVMPYLVKVAGLANLGIFASAEAVITYFIVLCDYGFSLTGARQTAESRDDRSALSQLLSAVMAIKSCVAVLGLALLAVAAAIGNPDATLRNCVLLLYIGVLGNVFYAPWFFQGMEDTRPLAVAQIAVSVATIGMTYGLVHGPSDIHLAALAYGASMAIGGLLCFVYAVRRYKLRLVVPAVTHVVAQLRTGWLVFLSMLSVNIYATLNLLFLGMISGPAAVGLYKVVTTVVNAFTEALSPITASLYAPLVVLRSQSLAKYTQVLQSYVARLLPLYVLASVLLFSFGPQIIHMIGPASAEADAAIRIMAIIPTLQVLCLFGTMNLLALGKDRNYLFVSLAGAAITLVSSLPFIHFSGLAGAVGSYTLTVAVIACLYWAHVPRRQPEANPAESTGKNRMYAERKNPFWFGKNWDNFAPKINEQRIDAAEVSIRAITGRPALSGMSFLDIGCGSGLFSLAARRMGATRVVSFDVDPLSIRATTRTRDRYFAGDPSWAVVQGSVLFAADVAALEPADVVYSWGVLHHTGSMWEGVRNAASRVKPGGLLCLGLFNDAGYKSRLVKLAAWISHVTPERLFWLTAVPIATAAVVRNLLLDLARLRNPMDRVRNYSQQRGMSYWHDVVDGLASYPYEYASGSEVIAFVASLGFEHEHSRVYEGKTLVNDFRFRRVR